MSDVPILGQPVSLLMWYPTAVLNCKCLAEKGIVSIIITTGLNNPAKCGQCGKLYKINSVKPDGSLDIGFAIPLPPGQVM